MSTIVEEVEYEKLHLDMENPRLPSELPRTRKEVLTWIAKTTGIADLMTAIGKNGFFSGEPVVVYPHPKKQQGHYIVIEGNRRLVAVSLLHDLGECEKPTAQIVEAHRQAKHQPEKLPVVILKTRAEVLPYLGFRHITGIKEWDPLAKARYLKQLFDQTSSSKTPTKRYFEIAQTIGSRRDAIKRILDALAVYKIIATNDFFDIADLNEESIKFAILSTALADSRIGEYAGTIKNSGNDEVESTDPIVHPKSLKKEAIAELTRWLFEKKENGETVLGESRNLRKLGHVVATPKALAALKKGSTLTYAYRFTVGVNDDLMGNLYQAQAALSEAASMVANAKADAEAETVATDVHQLSKHVLKTLKNAAINDDDI